jgi:DNA-binding MarR family transcriptional regulator
MAERDLTAVDALGQLSFTVQSALALRAGEEELSLIQTRLLGILRDRTPTMNELAQRLALDKSSVTGLIDRAEVRGLVERASSSSDGRATLVSLTTQGRKVATRVAGTFAQDIDQLLSVLSESEAATLVRLIERLLSATPTRT